MKTRQLLRSRLTGVTATVFPAIYSLALDAGGRPPKAFAAGALRWYAIM